MARAPQQRQQQPAQALGSPLQRRSQYLAQALEAMRQEPQRIGGFGDLGARLLAQALTQAAAEKTDKAVSAEQSNEALRRRRAMFPGLTIEGEEQEVGNGRLGNPFAGFLRRGQPPIQPRVGTPPIAPDINSAGSPTQTVAPIPPVENGGALPPVGMMPQDPVPAAPQQQAMPQAQPQQAGIPPQLEQQIMGLLSVGTPEAEQQAFELYQGWQQQQQILASLTPEQRANPDFAFAARYNPEELAGSLSYGFRPVTGAAGSSIITPATGQRFDVPDYETVNDTIYRTTGAQVEQVATAPPEYQDVTRRIEVNQVRPVEVSPGGAVVSFDPNTGQTAPQFERAPSEKPLSASEQNAIDALEIDIRFGGQALGNVRSVMADIDSGAFRLDPVSRASYETRNRTGNSSPESLAYARALTTVSNLRNTLLRENKGTQTEGDAIRILEEVIANWGDERVVRQGLAQFEQLYGGIQEDRQRQLDRRRSGEARQVGGGSIGPIAEDANGNRVQWNGQAWVPLR